MSDLPVTVVGGYLGAGKTTLINSLLRHANGLRLAVLVNEFGALSIDEDLIEAQDDDIISIAGGCICCSFGSDLTAALVDLSRLETPPQHILIESSGVAIPGAIVQSLQLVTGFQSDGIVVLVDAETVQDMAADTYLGDTITRQLSDADIVVINKIDLVSAAQTADTQDWLKRLAPNAQMLPTEHAAVPLDAVLGCGPAQRVTAPGTHADAMFDRILLSEVRVADPHAFAQALATGGCGVVRAKGFVHDAAGARVLLHVVGKRAEVRAAEGAGVDGVVCIGRKGVLNPAGIDEILTAARI